MPPSLRLAFAALLALTVGPAGAAQVSGSLGVGYLDYAEVGRWGVAGGVYIPFADHAFDLVPNAVYYHSKWSVGSEMPQRDVFAVSLDGHANLPTFVTRVRPFVGTGVTYVGAGGETGFGLNLMTGVYVRALSWRAFPFAQVTYRVVPDFETQAPLDTYAVHGGLRVHF